MQKQQHRTVLGSGLCVGVIGFGNGRDALVDGLDVHVDVSESISLSRRTTHEARTRTSDVLPFLRWHARLCFGCKHIDV